MLRTRTIDNDLNPKWNQSFNLLVDDLDTQSLRALSLYAACMRPGYTYIWAVLPFIGGNSGGLQPLTSS